MVPPPVVGTTGSGGSLGKTPMTDLPHPQSGRPRPRVARRVGQNNDPDEAFNLRQRQYPLVSDVSMAEPMAAISPASGKLLAAKEGHVGETRLDPPVGEHPRELHLGQVPPHLPRLSYELPVNRNQDQPVHGPLPNRMYSGDARYGHEAIPFHLAGINPGWYDPLGRGPDVRYSPYHPQFILPPPFAARQYANYPNDPTIHLQPSAMGRGHYANVPPPFHSPLATEYVSPNGGHEPPAYRHAHLYDPMPTQESANRSAGVTATRSEAISDSSDLPAGDITDTSGT